MRSHQLILAATAFGMLSLAGIGEARATRRNIDTFMQPEPPLTVVIDDLSWILSDNEMPGSDRDILVEWNAGSNDGLATLRVGSQPGGALRNGVLDFATRGGPSARLTLQYDGEDPAGDGWTNAEGLREGVSRWSRIRFYFDHYENFGGISIFLTGEGGEWAHSSADFIPISGPDSAISPEISDFVQSPGFKNVPITSYTFRFDTGADSKFRLQSVRIVPEPTTWALLLSGLPVAWLFRKYRLNLPR